MQHRLRTFLVASLGTVGLIVGGGAILSACQRHDFERVTPKAIEVVQENIVIEGVQQPAKVMLVIDKSGSMRSNVENSDWGCCNKVTPQKECDGYNNTANCKWNKLKEVLKQPGGLLKPASASEKPLARFGLSIFPAPNSSNACAPGNIAEEIPSEPSTESVERILSSLEQMVPVGGTPSAVTLDALLNNETFIKEESYTKRFVVFLTDGLPNCNDEMKDSSNCKACTNGYPPENNCSLAAEPKTIGCWKNWVDDVRLVQAISSLRERQVDTIVVGIGSDTSNPTAQATMNAAAEAGGQANSGDIKYFQVNKPEDFEIVLNSIRSKLTPCEIGLPNPPGDLTFFEVALLDTQTNSTTTLVRDIDWRFKDNSNKIVELLPARCQELQQSPNRYHMKVFDIREK